MEDLQISTIDSSVDTRSTSNNYPNYNYDVFISHRGPDVKNTFAGYLYRDLHAHGLQPFLDKEALRAGEYIDPQIEGAIESAYIHIVILSPGFVDSRWCLNELLLMLKKTGDIIIPIFYNVKPSELRWAKYGRYAQALTKHEQTGRYERQILENWRNAVKDVSYRVSFKLLLMLKKTVDIIIPIFYNVKPSELRWAKDGCYAQALTKHEQTGRYERQTLENWRNALKDVSYRVGFELDTYNGDEVKLLEKVVGCVLKHRRKAAVQEATYATSLPVLQKNLGLSTNLRVLNFSGCGSLQMLSDSLECFPNLETLNISECASLQELPASITNLRSLQVLNISRCKKLRALPESFGALSSLRHLELSGCMNLQELPDSFARLRNLQELNISGCERLRALPDSFGRLQNLQTLVVSGCNSLERLPDSFGSLTNLEVLDLSRCGSLQGLPDSFGYLSNLEILDLSRCGSLQGLPDSFGYLSNLEVLDLSRCGSLQGLPDSFGYLSNLRDLHLSDCESLRRLPDSFRYLRNLRNLDLSGCRKLQGLSVLQARAKQHGINSTQTAPFSPRFRPPIRSSRCKTVVSASAAYNSRLVGAFEFKPMFKIF